jgi:hypothetical protein
MTSEERQADMIERLKKMTPERHAKMILSLKDDIKFLRSELRKEESEHRKELAQRLEEQANEDRHPRALLYRIMDLIGFWDESAESRAAFEWLQNKYLREVGGRDEAAK